MCERVVAVELLHNELKNVEERIFLQGNAMFASKTKINFFFNFFEDPERVKKKFQKMLILVFEVIVQPPKHTLKIGIFPRFSQLWTTVRGEWLKIVLINRHDRGD